MKENKVKRLYVRVNEKEKKKITGKATGFKSVSDYARSILLNDHSMVINPVEILKSLDKINLEMSRTGTNINQFAKYVNQRKSEPDDAVLSEFNQSLNEYVKELKKLEICYRKIIAS